MRNSPISLMGPTGSGKSALALALAAKLNAEIITVDSAQVYRGMDIGTAKPSVAEQSLIKHHLLDICEPEEHYSVAQFVRDATSLIAEIQARGRRPLLVGGTMLYFRALQAGLATLPAANSEVRVRLSQEAAAVGWPQLHAKLKTIDPEAFTRISANDGQRIQRALEVYELTGRALSSFQQQALKDTAWPFPKIILAPASREALRPNLVLRLAAMREQGLIEEVTALRARSTLTKDTPSMRAVGYRQIWQALEGQHSMDVGFELAFKATWALAKRQYTWLKKETQAHWFDPESTSLLAAVEHHLITHRYK